LGVERRAERDGVGAKTEKKEKMVLKQYIYYVMSDKSEEDSRGVPASTKRW